MAKKAPAKPKQSSKDVNPKVELVARKGSELAHKGDYSNALAHFEKVLSVDPKHLYALYGAAHCKSHLMEHLRSGERDAAVDGVLALCHRLILRTPEASLDPEKKEHVFPRETLRFAYDKIASYALERAKTKRDLEVALRHIDHCLSLTSPLDDKHALAHYIETKVRILLRIGRKDEASALQGRRKEDRKSRRSLEG